VAGIDLASELHWACAPTLNRTGREMARFGATTAELLRMAEWLKERGVKSVAMETTGLYWVVPHEVLEGAGFELLLVDTRQLARVPGRDNKSDPQDCQWIQRLHSCGLLKGSFLPGEEIGMLRTLVRDRGVLVAERGDWVRRMQKSLDQMNVRIHRAVSDLDGETGMRILRAIVAGERDGAKLAKLRDARCQKSEQEIAEQLTGYWREDHLFSLGQALKMYDAIEQRIADYEQAILARMAALEREGMKGREPPHLKNANKARCIRRRGEDDRRKALYQMTGVDLTAIDGIGVEAVQTLLSEYGPDLSRFPTEKEFVKHLTLTPNVPTSGGKPVKKKHKPNTASSRGAAVLRMAALSLRHSPTALGAYYRSLARRKDGGVAIFATARKLATLIYRALRWGQDYIDIGAEAYDKRLEEQHLRTLTAKAKQLGYQLIPA
jgi:transposase